MKAVRDWDTQDLVALPMGEHDWLEIKGRAGLDLTLSKANVDHVRNILSKAVSAFANSGGGVLVFGLVDPRDGWHVDDGGISLTMKPPSTREWLENVIPDLVDPPLRKFGVYVFTNPTSELEIDSGRCIVVIEIDDSEQAPHQANDHKYYGRLGGKSCPLNHRFVSDIFHRRRDPIINLSFEIEILHRLIEETSVSERFGLIITANNRGRILAQYVNAVIDLPQPLLSEEDWDEEDVIYTSDGNPANRFYRANTRRDVVGQQSSAHSIRAAPQYGPTWFEPILPGLNRTWSLSLPESIDHISSDATIYWCVFADNAPMQSGSIRWADIPRTMRFTTK